MGRRFIILTIGLMTAAMVARATEKVDSAEVIAKHLDSIGAQAARTADTLRTGSGTAFMSLITGGAGTVAGTSVVASKGNQFNFLLYFHAGDYLGEQFKFDGKNALVADSNVATRTNLALFMYRHDAILKEGLWGGVWNSSWPLQNLNARGAQLRSEGTKKIDGKNLLQFRYEPKHIESEIRIFLFFDPETYHHVRTMYEYYGAGNIPTITVLEEFSDFKEEAGLTLPQTWTVRYEPDQNGGPEIKWDIRFNKVSVANAAAK